MQDLKRWQVSSPLLGWVQLCLGAFATQINNLSQQLSKYHAVMLTNKQLLALLKQCTSLLLSSKALSGAVMTFDRDHAAGSVFGGFHQNLFVALSAACKT